jgi:hypothetical protein
MFWQTHIYLQRGMYIQTGRLFIKAYNYFISIC